MKKRRKKLEIRNWDIKKFFGLHLAAVYILQQQNMKRCFCKKGGFIIFIDKKNEKGRFV